MTARVSWVFYLSSKEQVYPCVSLEPRSPGISASPTSTPSGRGDSSPHSGLGNAEAVQSYLSQSPHLSDLARSHYSSGPSFSGRVSGCLRGEAEALTVNLLYISTRHRVVRC